jgi:hypothetical protein
MSATEIIQQLENLPPEEQRKVFAYLRAHETAASAPGDQPTGVVSEEFKKIADDVFAKNDELFRKLAQ